MRFFDGLARNFFLSQAFGLKEYFVYFESGMRRVREKGPSSHGKDHTIPVVIKNAYTEDPMYAIIESSSLRLPPDLAPRCTQVAGFHRAVPSTALDKACMQFEDILLYFSGKSSIFSYIFQRKC